MSIMLKDRYYCVFFKIVTTARVMIKAYSLTYNRSNLQHVNQAINLKHIN